MEKTVSQLDASGYFVGPTVADESPLEPDVFLIPGGAVDLEPPAKLREGMRYRPGSGNQWIEEPIPVEPAPPPLSIDELRHAALNQLPAWESAERSLGIDHAGQRWLTTPAALQDIRDALLAESVPGGRWVTATREVVPLDLVGLRALWAAIVARGALIYRRRLELETLIPTLNRDQLEAFAPGWPAENAG